MGQHRKYIFHIDKIAFLCPISKIIAMTSKERYAARFPDLVESMKNNGSHAVFVVLVRTENIEKFEPRPEWRCTISQHLIHHPQIETMLAIAIRIQGL